MTEPPSEEAVRQARADYRLIVATVVFVAIVAATTGFLPLHAAFVQAGQSWFAWLDTAGLEGLVLGCGLVLFQRPIWSAWALVLLSILVNVAASGMPVHPWLAVFVAPWPIVAVVLGCLTFVRGAHSLEKTE